MELTQGELESIVNLLRYKGNCILNVFRNDGLGGSKRIFVVDGKLVPFTRILDDLERVEKLILKLCPLLTDDELRDSIEKECEGILGAMNRR